MTNTEAIIRTILGPIRRDTRPLACSVDCLSELLFVQKIPMDEIMVTKDIYPEVAKQLNKNPLPPLSRRQKAVERLVLCCWEEGNRAYLAKIIGRNLTTLREPREMLFYLSVYSHWNVPFFTAVQAQPSLLF